MMAEYCPNEGLDPCVETTLKGHRQSINWIAFSGDGRQLVSGSDDKHVMLWSLDEKQSICYRMGGHSSAVLSVAFTQHYLLSSSKDCSVRLWRFSQINGRYPENESVVYRCHSSSIRCVDANADATQFCTASDDKTVKIWSPNATNKFIASLSGVHTNWVRHCQYSGLNPHLIGSCGDDGLVCIWDIRAKEAVIQLTSRRKSTHFVSLQWHPNCEHILSTSSADTSIRIWDLRKEKMIQYYAAHTGSVNATAFHSSGNYLLSASSDETSKIFDLLEGRGLFTLKAHNGPINCCAFTSDGQYFATAGNDKQIMVWKSNLIDDFDQNDTILGNEQHSYETVLTKQRAAGHQTCSVPTVQTPVMNSNKTPLKSALRRTNSEEKKAPVAHRGVDHSKHRETERDVNNRDVGVESGDQLCWTSTTAQTNTHTNSHSITQSIVNQLKSLTDSVLMIEERLSTLEDRFTKHCTAQSGNSSSNG